MSLVLVAIPNVHRFSLPLHHSYNQPPYIRISPPLAALPDPPQHQTISLAGRPPSPSSPLPADHGVTHSLLDNLIRHHTPNSLTQTPAAYSPTSPSPNPAQPSPSTHSTRTTNQPTDVSTIHTHTHPHPLHPPAPNAENERLTNSSARPSS